MRQIYSLVSRRWNIPPISIHTYMTYIRKFLEWLLSLLPPDPDTFAMMSMPLTAPRSGKWSKVRDDHLASQPACQMCGSTKLVQVHHIEPFHNCPEKELDSSNLITLCEGGHHCNCHLLFGHLLSWKSHNSHVVEDAKLWAKKIANRPE